MRKSAPEDQPKHPIQVVARRTGLSVDVIRVWERRYQAVSPGRTEARRRLYSDAEVNRLLLLRRATEAGRRIGDVAALPTDELARLVAADRGAEPGTAAGPEDFVESCLEAAERMDSVGLEGELARAAVNFSVPVLLERVVAALMREVGERWHRGELRVGQEHLVSAAVRSFLGGLYGTSNMGGTGPVLLVTTPLGQNHELGALMAAVLAAADGWHVVHLAPNTPAADIAAAARQVDARAVALALAYPQDDPRLVQELRLLRQQLEPRVALLVGGRASDGYTEVLSEIGARQLASLAELRAALAELRTASAAAPSPRSR